MKRLTDAIAQSKLSDDRRRAAIRRLREKGYIAFAGGEWRILPEPAIPLREYEAMIVRRNQLLERTSA